LINIYCVFRRLIHIPYIGSPSNKAIISSLWQRINRHILILHLLPILKISLVPTSRILRWTYLLIILILAICQFVGRATDHSGCRLRLCITSCCCWSLQVFYIYCAGLTLSLGLIEICWWCSRLSWLISFPHKLLLRACRLWILSICVLLCRRLSYAIWIINDILPIWS